MNNKFIICHWDSWIGILYSSVEPGLTRGQVGVALVFYGLAALVLAVNGAVQAGKRDLRISKGPLVWLRIRI